MKKLLIKNPVSPITLIGSELLTACHEIDLSFGMGNGSATYYCTESKDVHVNGVPFLQITLLNGEMIEINPAFIFRLKPVTIVKVIYDITGWLNYHNKKHPTTHRHNYYLLKYNETYEIVDKNSFTGDECEKRIIHRHSEDIVIE